MYELAIDLKLDMEAEYWAEEQLHEEECFWEEQLGYNPGF